MTSTDAQDLARQHQIETLKSIAELFDTLPTDTAKRQVAMFLRIASDVELDVMLNITELFRNLPTAAAKREVRAFFLERAKPRTKGTPVKTRYKPSPKRKPWR